VSEKKTITVPLTPRAEAFLHSLFVAHEEFRADVERDIADEKEARRRAVDAGTDASYVLRAPGWHRGAMPEALTLEQIAEKALERGAAGMLHVATEARMGPRHLVQHDVGIVGID
jgi:hypothetical protein